jgi:hypothetical protein
MTSQHSDKSRPTRDAGGDNRSVADSTNFKDMAPVPNRRRFLEVAGLGVLGGLVAYTGYMHYERRAALNAARESYGTLGTPLFQANPDLSYGKLLTPYQKLQESRSADLPKEEAQQFMKVCEDGEKLVKKLAQRLSSENPSDTTQAVGNSPDLQSVQAVTKLRIFCTDASTNLMIRSMQRLNLATDSVLLQSALDEVSREKTSGDYTENESEYGSPVAFVRKLTREITGRELPEDITF